MKFVNFHRKPISLFVMLAFTVLLCVWANQAPAAPASPASEKGSDAALENSESESTGFIETEEAEPVVKKGKKFPWLIVGAAVVIGAAAVYFLVIKKPKYTLNVSLTGATGTPAETTKYKKDTVVNYTYSVQSGYVNLEVKLDGAVVPASGTVTMDKDHALTATAVQGSAISVSSTPSGAKIFLNNADSGFTTPHTFQYTTAVNRTVLLRLCGYQDYSQTVTANLGQTVTVDRTLSQGILDDFVVPSACWVPHTDPNTTWTVSGGAYKCLTSVKQWGHVYYNTTFSSTSYTAEAKMRRMKGSRFNSNSIILSTTTDMRSINGYLFNYTADGWYSIWKYTDKNLIDGSGNYNVIKGWTSHNSVAQNLKSWNILKIVRSGSNYTFYVNGKNVYAFSQSAWDPRVFVMVFFCGNETTEMEYDYAKLALGATVGLMPGEAPLLIQDPSQKDSGRL